jgi:hypothetical protein
LPLALPDLLVSMLPTVFNEYGTKRLAAWRQFRDSLETSYTPLEDVAKLWTYAPFVSPYLDPKIPTEWPDPWHLMLDLHLDDLALVLGMLYTIKLTQRFIDTNCEIHMSMSPERKEPLYLLVVGGERVLNLVYGAVVDVSQMRFIDTKRIYSVSKLQ